MTQSYTTTETWSQTHARYVAGKVAADLRQIQQAYGRPSDTDIENFTAELTILLTCGYVQEITYGFKREGSWVVALKYVADMNGNLTIDDRSGRIPRGEDIRGAAFHSFLVTSAKWDGLSPSEKNAVESTLPFVRSAGIAPDIKGGTWRFDKSYASAGSGVRRGTIGGAS